MRFLLDTNILIKLEPSSPDEIEPDASLAVKLNQLLTGQEHTALVHPAIEHDINRDTDTVRQVRNRFLFGKWPSLQHPPEASEIDQVLGVPAYGSNDWVDHQLALAVASNAVDYVITEDVGLIRRLQRAGLGDRGLRVADAVDLLESLGEKDVPPPPQVTQTFAYSLNRQDPIWKSFRAEYDQFDAWLDKAAQEHRIAWYIAGGERYDAIAIIKSESNERPHGLSGKVLKLCSFKVEEQARGSKYGELLLKTVFRYAHANHYDSLYVEVFPSHKALVSLMEEFGFRIQEGSTTWRGELVLAKTLKPDPTVAETLTPFDYHLRYGPPAIHPYARLFVVPILPRFHMMLFPDLEAELQLQVGPQPTLPGFEVVPERPRPFGNAIKKAYLSHATIRSLEPGDCLLFYRSQDIQGLTVAGVVESTFVSTDPVAIAAFVGPRTVYPMSEIKELTVRGEVLAILFRHDRPIAPVITLEELRDQSALTAAPQSIVAVKQEGDPWLRSRIIEQQ